MYNFQLSADIDDEFAFYDIDPYRQTFIVLALTSYRSDATPEEFSSELKLLRSRYPHALVHRVLVFGVPSEDATQATKHVYPVLSAKVGKNKDLEKAVSSITSDFLGELSVYAISKELGSFKSPALKELDAPAPNGGKTRSRRYNSVLKHSQRDLVSPSESTPNLARSTSFTKTGSISIGLSDRAKSRQQGRTLKFMADLHLISGRVDEALKKFTEAASILKATFDHLWYASALERIGVCLILQAFMEQPATIPLVATNAVSGSEHTQESSSASLRREHSRSRSSSPVSIAGTGGSGSPQASLQFSASSTNLASSSQPPLREFLPELTEVVLRHFYRCQGHSEEAVPQVMFCETALRVLKLLVALRVGGGWNRASLSAIVRGTGLERNVTGESPTAVEITQWFNRIYSTELANLHIVAQCRIYSGLASALGSAGLVRKENFVLRELLLNLETMTRDQSTEESGFRALKSLDASTKGGLIALLEHVCTIYSAGDVHSQGCGWQTLKISVIRSCISICETLGDASGVVHFASLLISTSADMLSKEEQLVLFSKVHKATQSAQNAGVAPVTAAPYWDRHILRDLRYQANTTNVPVRQTLKDTSAHTSSLFLYNPYKRDTISRDPALLVEGEPAEFLLKLQNPFEFEIHITRIELVSDSVVLKGSARNIYLPPSGIYDAVITVTPQSHGLLNVTGCVIQVAGCEPEEFPLLSKPLPLPQLKSKHFGVYAGEAVHEHQSARETQQLALRVIPAQPLVALKHMGLEQGSIVLFEGEKKTLPITLANYTDSVADTLQFSFSDSTLEPLQAELANRDISPVDAYEFEYFLYNRHSLRLLSEAETVLEPQSAKEFSVEITGKRGMSSASIIIDYGRRVQESSDAWTRRVSIPIGVTIAGGIEMAGTDIVPFSSVMRKQIDQLDFADVPADAHYETLVLMLDLRNTAPQPLETTLWSYVDDSKAQNFGKVTHTIAPNSLKRFLLPVRWKYIERALAQRPIPSISNRQYVVDTTLSPEQQLQQREAFWFRYHLLNLLGGSWQTEDGRRTGATELRGMRLHRSVVSLLRDSPIDMELSFDGSAACKPNSDSSWTVETGTPIALNVAVTNTSTTPLSGTLTLFPQPRYDSVDSRDILRNLVYEGDLTRFVPTLQQGESANFQVHLIVLVRGDYMWTSTFEIDSIENKYSCSSRKPLYVRAVRSVKSPM